MITPSFSLTSTERVLPKLALDFTTASLDPRVTFTRSGDTATVTNSSGVIVAINANLPRFDFSPSTLVCKGLLIEEGRTNVLLNSLIDGTNLATQIVTVTAAARTLSFYGNGTVVLSGAHSATVVGTGAYPTRTTLTFTPTAGALTLTVSGTVQFAQLETGAFATSFIPTGLTAVTRNADVATMTGTNFSSWFNATEGAFVASAYNIGTLGAGAPRLISASNGANTNLMEFYGSTPNIMGFQVLDGSVAQANITAIVFPTDLIKLSGAYKVNSFAISSSGSVPATNTSGTVPSLNKLNIGNRQDLARGWNGCIQKVNYYNLRLTDAEVQAFSK